MEWAWARSNNEYPTKANGMDLEKLGTEILDKYSVSQIPKDPAENDEFDISLEGMTATAGSEQAGSETEGWQNMFWITIQERCGTLHGWSRERRSVD